MSATEALFFQNEAASVEAGKTRKPKGAPRGNRNAVRSGVYGLVALQRRGKLDKRTALSRAFSEALQEYVESLGGQGEVSPQERAILTDTVWTDFYVAAIDAHVSQLRHLVRKGKPHPLLELRVRLASHRRENFKAVGLKRRAKPALTLPELLARRAEQRTLAGAPGKPAVALNGNGAGKDLDPAEIIAPRANGEAREGDNSDG